MTALKIGDNSVRVVKIKKNHSMLVLENEETQTRTLSGVKGVYASTNTSIEEMFSDKGLTIKNVNIKAIGNYTALTLKILNKDTNKLLTLNTAELQSGKWQNNDKVPKYIKTVLASIIQRIESVKKYDIEVKPVFRESVKKQAIKVLSVMCPDAKCIVPITKCLLCPESINNTEKNQLMIRYVKSVADKKHINSMVEFNAFLNSLTDAEKLIFSTVKCRLEQ